MPYTLRGLLTVRYQSIFTSQTRELFPVQSARGSQLLPFGASLTHIVGAQQTPPKEWILSFGNVPVVW